MKKILLTLSIVTALALPLTAFAASTDSPIGGNNRSYCGFGVNSAKLTEQQKTDLSGSFDKMIELRKETINKMVQNGSITKENGSLALSRIDEMAKFHGSVGDGSGMMSSDMMNGYGLSGSKRISGFGMMNAQNLNGYSGSGMMNWQNN